MAESIAYNIDCLEYMKTLPDNYFDICVADPPYGDGLHAEDGGSKGWFTKYNQKATESEYNQASSQTVNVERERESRTSVEPIRRTVRQVQGSRSASTAGTDGTSTSASRQGGENTVARTGGTWAEKYGKKSLRGTLPQRKNTLTKSFASHARKLFGAATTSTYHLHGASLCGANSR